MKDDKRNSDQNFEDSIIESEDKFNSNEDLNVWYDLRTDIKEDFEKVTSIQGDLKEDIKRVMSILNNQGKNLVESEDSSVDGIIVDIPINIPSADDGVIDDFILRITMPSAPSADYVVIDDFILLIALKATRLSSSIENMQRTGVCTKYINDDAEGDIANGAEVETPCNKLKKKKCKNKKHKKKKICESPKRLTSNDGAVVMMLVHI